MSNQSTVEENAAAVSPSILPNVAEILQAQLKTLIQGHSELLGETEKAMAAWTKRGQEAVESGIRTFQAAWACRDAAALTQLYQDWLNGSMSRIFVDLSDAHERALRLAEIGQKSAAVLWRSSPDLESSPSSAAAEEEVRKSKGGPRIEAAREDRREAATA